ncbi:alpha-ketoglutarate-dependent dioxygenase AlkB [Pseudolysobacter antarcticus]|uniref:Alpha-ketoglutarate-dependent dioxygenase AlkB n=1 Tax=Pseudolysobacter antarcticus TaxID=2511995 RepID=A0A411HIA1_9GAMM|nr:alpha-ketoglutarate-dependent dioxygenase AlkB [Pseudolysobacter antarcticus]QBB70144.1 alpha-ketoglutarate-dependent dioxygenase AlkB [Pseudolysobacter antarcticus]
MQSSLFPAETQILWDDHRGAITYHPGCIPLDLAERWFVALRDSITWADERRRMYDRDVDVPRLVARFALDDPNLPEIIASAADAVSRTTGAMFNSVGLNFYRDGRDSVAPHNDKLHDLVVDAPIAILSLGAVRRMTIRTKTTPRTILHLDLAPGSLFVMSYATQLHFDHGIPKVTTPTGARISLAFRQRQVTT